jgi:hypothetical protein
LGDLKHVEGIVVTEFGPVSVCWDRSGEKGVLDASMEIPDGITARVFVPCLSKDAKLSVNDQSATPSTESTARFMVIQLSAGKNAIHVAP